MNVETEPKFRQVADRLAADIVGGQLQGGDKLPGERVLARQYGISHPTMNKAVSCLVESGVLRRESGRGTFVAEQPVAPAVVPTRMRADAVLVAMDLHPDRHLPFATALPRYLAAQGRLPLMLDGARGCGFAERFAELAVDDILCVISFHVEIPYERLVAAAAHCRFVFLGDYVWEKRLPGSYVLTDFYAGGRQAAAHVLARGRERLLLLSTPTWGQNQAPSLWERGIRDALREAGAAEPRLVDATTTAGQTYRDLFAGPDAPDAVLSITDFRLMEMIQAIAPLGLQPGADFDAIGCYDTPWAEAWGLSSLSVGVDRALTHLDTVLDGRRDIDVLVAPSLICRRSAPAASR